MAIERQVLIWLIAAALAGLALGILRPILLPFVAGLVIAYFLNPLVDRLARSGLSRILASALIIAGGAGLLIATLMFLVPVLVSQAQALAVALPGELERFRGLIDTWARDRLGERYPAFEAGLNHAFAMLAENSGGYAANAARSVWNQGTALVSLLSLLLVTPLVAFYLLVDWHRMLAQVDGWLPRDHASTIRRLALEINVAVSAFVRGQGTVCLALALYYSAALGLTGVPYGLLIGIATGALSFMPFVGWALGFLTAGILALVHAWPDLTAPAIVAAIYLGGQALDAGWLSPAIVGKRIGLHPVWLIFALFVFSTLFGFLGVLVAVPVAAALAVLVRFGLKQYLASPLYHGRTGTAGSAARQREVARP